MEAIRITGEPKDGKITIDLPEELRDQKKVEIIVLPYEDEPKRRKGFDPTKFRGAVKLDMTVNEIAGECKKMRDEWERGF